MYFLGFTYTEALNLPIVYKRWFLERAAKLMQGTASEGEPGNGPTKDMRAQNDAAYAMSRGKHRVQTPARLRRF